MGKLILAINGKAANKSRRAFPRQVQQRHSTKKGIGAYRRTNEKRNARRESNNDYRRF